MIKVLIIDDDPQILELISTVLDKNEFSVTTASSGLRGLELVKSLKPDFIMLDQILPDLSGSEVLATLKQDIDTKSIPVVIFSAYSTEEVQTEMLQAGAADYLSKYDLDMTKLGTKIKVYLKLIPPSEQR